MPDANQHQDREPITRVEGGGEERPQIPGTRAVPPSNQHQEPALPTVEECERRMAEAQYVAERPNEYDVEVRVQASRDVSRWTFNRRFAARVADLEEQLESAQSENRLLREAIRIHKCSSPAGQSKCGCPGGCELLSVEDVQAIYTEAREAGAPGLQHDRRTIDGWDCPNPDCQARPTYSNECRATSWQLDGFAICRGPAEHDGGHVWDVQ